MRVDGNEVLLEHLGSVVGAAARQGTRNGNGLRVSSSAAGAAVGHAHERLLGFGGVREDVQGHHVGLVAAVQGLSKPRRVVVDHRVVGDLDLVVMVAVVVVMVEDLAVVRLVHGVLLLLQTLLGVVRGGLPRGRRRPADYVGDGKMLNLRDFSYRYHTS